MESLTQIIAKSVTFAPIFYLGYSASYAFFSHESFVEKLKNPSTILFAGCMAMGFGFGNYLISRYGEIK